MFYVHEESENMSEHAKGNPVTNPVTGRRTSTESYRMNCHDERCNRKRIHTHFLKDRNCEMQEGQNYLDSMQETHSKIWED